jgi:threonine/homoserine/homoserine lactone efflux protein
VFGTHDLALFVLSGLLLNITPGADTLYIVGRSAAQGARSGTMAALGVGAGCFVHMFAAALGLSAILAASATAFTVVKLIGAAYLIYLGVSLLRTSAKSTAAQPTRPLRQTTLRMVFFQGLLTNVLNPKVALFFLAFLPQFIDQDAPDKVLGFLFLGMVFNVNGTLWNLFVAWSSARVGHRARSHHRYGVWLNRVAGGVFIGLGIRLAFSRPD